jgi:heme/copper-type cytochrome/quinol oxidase subunit 2
MFNNVVIRVETSIVKLDIGAELVDIILDILYIFLFIFIIILFFYFFI